MVLLPAVSVVIDIINVLSVLVTSARTIRAAEAFRCDLERMQPEPRQVYMANRRDGMKGRQKCF
jgi:hypothetical protein